MIFWISMLSILFEGFQFLCFLFCLKVFQWDHSIVWISFPIENSNSADKWLSRACFSLGNKLWDFQLIFWLLSFVYWLLLKLIHDEITWDTMHPKICWKKSLASWTTCILVIRNQFSWWFSECYYPPSLKKIYQVSVGLVRKWCLDDCQINRSFWYIGCLMQV